jgi:hypothetical protein
MSNGQFSPPNGNYPQEVSEKWVLEDGTIQENLKELTDEQLNALGWSGPITFPAEYVYYSNNVEWNKETKSFDIIPLREDQEDEVKRRIDYRSFWDKFASSAAYTKIKNYSTSNLEANLTLTELIAHISDGKLYKQILKSEVQAKLDYFTNNITFTTDELSEVNTIFIETGFAVLFTFGE